MAAHATTWLRLLGLGFGARRLVEGCAFAHRELFCRARGDGVGAALLRSDQALDQRRLRLAGVVQSEGAAELLEPVPRVVAEGRREAHLPRAGEGINQPVLDTS